MSLPTRAQLAQLASELYLDSNGNPVTFAPGLFKFNLKLKDKYKNNPPLTLGHHYWDSEESSTTLANRRLFDTTVTHDTNGGNYYKSCNEHRAMCISN